MKKILLLVGAVVTLVVAWQFWTFREDRAALDRAREAVRSGDFDIARSALAARPDSLLGRAFGQRERAGDLGRLVVGALRLARLTRGDLVTFEAEVVERAAQYPTVAAAVAGEIARRLQQCVPDPIFVSGDRTLRLRDGHPVARLAIGERELPARSDGLFDAGALEDANEPREVQLTDPHGFQAVTRALVRVDFTPPKVVRVTVPEQVQPGVLFQIEFHADEPIFAVADASVRGGRMLGAKAVGTKQVTVRILAGAPSEPGQTGYVLWSFRLRDRVGNVSEAVKGRVKADAKADAKAK